MICIYNSMLLKKQRSIDSTDYRKTESSNRWYFPHLIESNVTGVRNLAEL